MCTPASLRREDGRHQDCTCPGRCHPTPPLLCSRPCTAPKGSLPFATCLMHYRSCRTCVMHRPAGTLMLSGGILQRLGSMTAQCWR